MKSLLKTALIDIIIPFLLINTLGAFAYTLTYWEFNIWGGWATWGYGAGLLLYRLRAFRAPLWRYVFVSVLVGMGYVYTLYTHCNIFTIGDPVYHIMMLLPYVGAAVVIQVGYLYYHKLKLKSEKGSAIRVPR